MDIQPESRLVRMRFVGVTPDGHAMIELAMGEDAPYSIELTVPPVGPDPLEFYV